MWTVKLLIRMSSLATGLFIWAPNSTANPNTGAELLASIRLLAMQSDLTDVEAVDRALNVSFGPPSPAAISYQDGNHSIETTRDLPDVSKNRFGSLSYKVPPHNSLTALSLNRIVQAELNIGSPIPPTLCISTKDLKAVFGKPKAENHIATDVSIDNEPDDAVWEIRRSETTYIRVTSMAQGDDGACVFDIRLEQVAKLVR